MLYLQKLSFLPSKVMKLTSGRDTLTRCHKRGHSSIPVLRCLAALQVQMMSSIPPSPWKQ